jgi:hypothetical protein
MISHKYRLPLIMLLLLGAQFAGPLVRALVVNFLLLASFVSFRIIRRRYYRRLKLRSEIDLIGRDGFEQIANGHRQYFLFLRPFSADPVVEHKREKPSWRIGNIFEVFEYSEQSLNEVICQTVRTISRDLPLVALRGHRPSGVVENQDDIENWQTSVIKVAEGAQLIVVLLAATGGLEFELEQLARNGLFPKTVFVLPPAQDRDRRRYWIRDRGVLEEELEEIYEMLRNVGLNPPLPTQAGQVMFFGRNTDPVHAKWTWNGRALARIMELALHENRLLGEPSGTDCVMDRANSVDPKRSIL